MNRETRVSRSLPEQPYMEPLLGGDRQRHYSSNSSLIGDSLDRDYFQRRMDTAENSPSSRDVPETDVAVQNETPASIWSISRRQKLILACLAVGNMTTFMTVSIMAPFYPKEASNRGISEGISGWVFGVFALVQFVMSPIFSKTIPSIGAKFLFITGIFFMGGCTILFGFLAYMPGTSDYQMHFLVFSFVLRIASALGCSASATANVAMCGNSFPDHAAMVIGFLEIFTGLGLMTGPAVGGVLYDACGFIMPFAVMGGIMILTTPVYVCILPPTHDCGEEPKSVPLLKLLKTPAVLVTNVSVTFGAMIWVTLDPTLEPHLRQFNLSAAVIGLVFLLLSASYAITAPVWGWLAGKISNSTPLIMLGFYLAAIAMLLIGPSPLIMLDDYQHLWLNLLALGILGMSVSLAIIPGFGKSIDSAERSGIEMDLGANSAIAGIWLGSYALGEFIGPTVSGWLVDRVGFQWCMTYVSGSCAAAGTMMAILWIVESLCLKAKKAEILTSSISGSPSERTPLLGDQTERNPYTDSDVERRSSPSVNI